MHYDLQTFTSSFFRLSKWAVISPSQTNKQTTNQPECNYMRIDNITVLHVSEFAQQLTEFGEKLREWIFPVLSAEVEWKPWLVSSQSTRAGGGVLVSVGQPHRGGQVQAQAGFR